MQDRDHLLWFLVLRFKQEAPRDVSCSPEYQCACVCGGHRVGVMLPDILAGWTRGDARLWGCQTVPSLSRSQGQGLQQDSLLSMLFAKSLSQWGWQMLSPVRVPGSLLCSSDTLSEAVYSEDKDLL